MYIGALALKKESIGLLRAWLQAYKNRRLTMGSGEQNSLMVALQHNPIYRFFPLPYVFNFRRSSMLSRFGPQLPLVLHSHIFSNLSFKKDVRKYNLSNYKEVGKHAALLMFEDTYNWMQYGGGPYPFLCDSLVA